MNIDETPGGGAFNGTITGITQGAWYNVQVRFFNDTNVVDNGTNKIGVGILVGCLGQSNIEYWFPNGFINDTDLSPNSLVKMYQGSTWDPPENNGAVAFGNRLAEALSLPIGLLGYAVGATSIDAWYNGGHTNTYITALGTVGGVHEYVLWAQGESDAVTGMSEATYQSRLTDFVAYVRANSSFRDATKPVIISYLQRVDDVGVTDVNVEAIRKAQRTVISGGSNLYGLTMSDLTMRSGQWHFTAASYTKHGQRFAQAILYILGNETYYQGPQITKYLKLSSTVIEATLAHTAGTDFTPTSGIQGFEILDAGTPVTISSAVRKSATEITFTLSSALVGAESIRYMYGKGKPLGTTVAAPLDNTSLQLPLMEDVVIPSTSPSLSFSLSPSLSPSLSASLSPSLSPSISGSLSPSLSPSATESASPSLSFSLSPSLSTSASVSLSASLSPSLSPSRSSSSSVSPSPSPAGWTDIYSIQNTSWTDLYSTFNEI